MLYSNKPVPSMTEDELIDAAKEGIVAANNELQIRTNIRAQMTGFKDRVITLIETGQVQPDGIEATSTKEEFARSFLDNDETLNNLPSNAQMKLDYEERLFENPNTVATVLAKDVEDHRKAIAESLDKRKKTLLTEATEFVKKVNPTTNNAYRRRREAISKFFDSKKGKGTDQSIIVRNRKEFEDLANTGIYEERNKLRGRSVLQEINENIQKLDSYRNTISDVFNRLGGKRPWNRDYATLWDTLEMRDRLLEARLMYIRSTLHERASKIDRWQAGDIDPSEFRQYITGTSDPSEKVDIEKGFDSQLAHVTTAHPGGYSAWTSGTKIEAAANIQKDDRVAVAINEELAGVQREMNDLMNEIESMQTGTICNWCKDFFAKVDEAKENEKPETLFQRLKNAYQAMNIEWTTPMEIYLGWKKFWDVRKQTYEEKQRRGAARNAQKFGSFVKGISPFTNFENDVEQTLKAAVDNDDSSYKDAYIKLLKSGPEKFDSLFKPGGFYELNQHDPLRTKAVLEYAAEHGWLYDLDSETATVMGIKLVPGKNLPAGEDLETYLETLQSMDGNGSDKSRNEAKSSISTATSWSPIFKRFEKELSLNNLWGAIGVMEKAIDRGKDPATCSKLAVRFFRHMRDNQNIRKYITSDMLDQLGNISFSNVTWGYFPLKLDKESILAWASSQDPNRIENAGTFAATIKEVEARVIALETGTGRKIDTVKIDDLVGRILAGQVVKEEGWSNALSIFSPEFSKYRKQLAGSDPGKVTGGEDYRQKSEAILYGSTGLSKILFLTSQGGLQHESFAKPFLADIINRHNELRDPANHIDQTALQTFEEHWQNAFHDFIINAERLKDASQASWTFGSEFAPQKLTASGSVMESTKEDGNIWKMLYQHGLIKTATLDSKNNAFSKAVKN